MLMALLYTEDEKIIAAAPACDQVPYGDQYWHEFHGADFAEEGFETAYVTVANTRLRQRLMLVGIDESIDGYDLARDVEYCAAPDYVPGKAA